MIFELVCLPEKFDSVNIKDLIILNWDDCLIQEQWFLKEEPFIEKLIYRVDASFKQLLERKEDSDTFCQTFQSYIGRLLNLLIKYLPFKDEVINSVDFLELKDPFNILEQKIYKFNEIFMVVTDDEIRLTTLPEVLRLKTKGGLESFQYRSGDKLVDIWERIRISDQYPSLSKFAKLAQILPVSSFCVEQAFSIIKLFRTDQRNRLSENSLEGLILMHQEYHDKSEITISDEMVLLCKEIKENLNNRKSDKKRTSDQISSVIDTQSMDEILNSQEGSQRIEGIEGVAKGPKQFKSTNLNIHSQNSQDKILLNFGQPKDDEVTLSILEEEVHITKKV